MQKAGFLNAKCRFTHETAQCVCFFFALNMLFSIFKPSNKRSADSNDLDFSHNDQVTMGTQTADLQHDRQPVSNGPASQNISAIYHGAWPINTGKLKWH